MPKDVQRSRCYRAEQALSVGSQYEYRNGRRYRKTFMTIDQCQALVDSIAADPWVQATFPVGNSRWTPARRMRVQAGRNGGWAMPATGQISLGVWARQPLVVIHEVTHILVGTQVLGGAHGPVFCNALLALVHRFMGAEIGERLRRSYVSHGVEYGGFKGVVEPPKPLAQRLLWPVAPWEQQVTTPKPQPARAAKPAPGDKPPCTTCGTTDRQRSRPGGRCNRCYLATTHPEGYKPPSAR